MFDSAVLDLARQRKLYPLPHPAPAHLSPQDRAYLVGDPARPDTHYGGFSLRAEPEPEAGTEKPEPADAWRRTQKIVDEWRRTHPFGGGESEFNAPVPDTDRGYARYIDHYFADLPPDLQAFWATRSARDAETGEMLTGFEHGVRGTHVFDVRELADPLLTRADEQAAEPEAGTPGRDTSPPSGPGPLARLRELARDTRGGIPAGGPPQEIGPHGPVFRQFRHDAQGAIAKLKELKTGEAIAALHHPDIGDIDLIWGRPGTPEKHYDDGYGLAHIIEKHEKLQQEEVLGSLQEILEGLPVRSRTANRIQLWDDQHRAAVRLEWDGAAKRWLLTLFKKPSSPGRTTGVSGTRLSERGGTPPPEAATSTIGSKPGSVKTSEYQQHLDAGVDFLRAGATRFRDWSARMVERFGAAIKPKLLRLWKEAKRLARDERGGIDLNRWTRTRPRQNQETLSTAPADQLLTIAARMRKEGASAGRELMDLIERVQDIGERAAGKRLAGLMDLRLDKLSREQKYELIDTMEGRLKRSNPRIEEALAHAVTDILGEIAAEAQDFGGSAVSARRPSLSAFERQGHVLPDGRRKASRIATE